MEKLSNIENSAALLVKKNELPSIESLQEPFAPLKLSRPLKHFAKALGLQPGIAKPPDPDFLVHLLKGGGHQEQLRKAYGNQFKNLENFLRGAHAPTATTWFLLRNASPMNEELLRSLAHQMPDGPLMPAYVGLFHIVEGVFLWAYRAPTSGTIMCSYCGHDVLDDAHVWWTAQAAALSQDAYGFVDRLLKAMLGAALLMEGIHRHTASDSLDRALLLKLASPACHPIGNWMELVKISLGLQHDWQLSVRLQANQGAEGTVADGRLRKWRNGQDLLPIEKALSMVEATKQRSVLTYALYAARTLSLAIDVIQAAAETPARPSREIVQKMISARLQELHMHLSTGVSALSTVNAIPVNNWSGN